MQKQDKKHVSDRNRPSHVISEPVYFDLFQSPKIILKRNHFYKLYNSR